MSGFNQNLLNDVAGVFFGNAILRDYTHASKTFRTNSYQNAPKLKFLFHTYFSINPKGYPTDANFGLLVKEIKLPQFSFTTAQMNQYNRKRIIQTKIKYEPIEISFHDDNANQATQLWESYYRYYYNDTVKPGNVLPGNANTPVAGSTSNYNSRNIYSGDLQGNLDWGFNGGQSDSTGIKMPFFKNITVFGFNQHNFTAYTLVNPVITSFGHDTYNYAEGGGVMTNRMSIDYETVVYNYGNLDGRSPGDIVTGFGDNATYDRQVSPIAVGGSNGVVLGQGGLIQAAGGAIRSLTSGDVLGAIANASAVVNTVNDFTSPGKNSGIANKSAAAGLRNQNSPGNRNGPAIFPMAASSPSFVGTAGAPTIGVLYKPPIVYSQGSVTSQASDTSDGAVYQATTPFGAPVPTTIGLENQVNAPVGQQFIGKSLIGPFARGLAADTPFNPQLTGR
jgi:hypothetical protein